MSKPNPSTNRKAKAAVYLAAAKEVAEVMYQHERGERPQHKACCTALTDVDATIGEKILFGKYFMPKYASSFWFGDPQEPQNRNPRILALCFMAAMVEAGDA